MRARVMLSAIAVLAALGIAGCARPATTQQPASTTSTTVPTESVTVTQSPSAETSIGSDGKATIAVVVKSSPQVSTMAELLAASGLAKSLGGKGPYTLFVPTNAAFEKLPAGWLDKMKQPGGLEKLRTLLRAHLVKDKVPTSQMITIRRVMTYQGSVLKITSKGETVTLDGTVNIVQPDVPASNGVIDVTDAVIIPKGFSP
jgi:uncharacterized surface protein with fasciclin (FAS1) repeats